MFTGWYGLPVGRVRPGMGDGAELDKTHTKIRFFKGTPRREAKIALSNNSRPKTSGGRGPLGPRCRNQRPIRAVAAGLYSIIFIAPEYTPTAGGCRSPGAPGARRTSPPHCVFPPLLEERGLRASEGGEVANPCNSYTSPSICLSVASIYLCRAVLHLHNPPPAHSVRPLPPPLAGSRLLKGGEIPT